MTITIIIITNIIITITPNPDQQGQWQRTHSDSPAADSQGVLPRVFVTGRGTLDVPAVPVFRGFEPSVLQELPSRQRDQRGE